MSRGRIVHDENGVTKRKLCPCGKHPYEESGHFFGPHWDGDEPRPILVCPDGPGPHPLEPYIYLESATDSPLLFNPVWAYEEPETQWAKRKRLRKELKG